MKEEIRRLIEGIKVFDGLAETEKDSLSDLFRMGSFPKEEVIYREGEPGDSLDIIIEGKVRICKTTAEGDEFCLSTVRKGELFGIMSFLDGSRHSATIIADDDTRLLVLKKEDFDRYLETNPVICGKVLKGIATHLATIVRSMNSQYMDLMHLMFRKSK
jgi:CRP-like cAMP-binding protein